MGDKLQVGNPSWVKGVSGNPSGRPKGYKGIAKYIQSKTNGCEDLIDYLLSILAGTAEGGSTMSAKMWATEQLLNRGLGKAPAIVEVHNSLDNDAVATVIDVRGMSDEELEIWEKAAEIAQRHANKRKPIDV